MTKEDWLDWKNSPVTKLFFEAAVERREFVKEELIELAGQDSYRDAYRSGYAKCIEDFLSTDFEEMDNAEASRA